MTRRLYTVTLACPEIVVLAEDEADALRVVERTLRNGLLNPADGPAATGARELGLREPWGPRRAEAEHALTAIVRALVGARGRAEAAQRALAKKGT